MGYTHYWERPSVLPRPEFIAAVADCRRLCAAIGVPLAGADGTGQPTFNDNEICFNGRGEESYEAFVVKRLIVPRPSPEQITNDRASDFCKTNYLPYDLCVQGCLIVLSDHLGQAIFAVDSDGTSGQWNAARDACQRVLGYGGDWGCGKLAPLTPPPTTSAAG
ncbi:MAG TPA: hypothetical protein VFE47_18795 [Tepidisphaeraceae bacterium]|nr:hypothetical protein [Tepidisphaeraceae bacterium]